MTPGLSLLINRSWFAPPMLTQPSVSSLAIILRVLVSALAIDLFKLMSCAIVAVQAIAVKEHGA